MLTLMIVFSSDPCPLPLGIVMEAGAIYMEIFFTFLCPNGAGYILGLSAFCFSPLHHQEENDYGPKQSFRIPYDPKTTRIVAKVISPGAYQF